MFFTLRWSFTIKEDLQKKPIRTKAKQNIYQKASRCMIIEVKHNKL